MSTLEFWVCLGVLAVVVAASVAWDLRPRRDPRPGYIYDREKER